MNRILVAGAVLTVAGLAGYAVGIAVEYPGRAFSVTAVMVGVALVVMGNSGASEEVAQ